MKVIIQIPCLNEEKSLPIALGKLPRSLPGVDKVEWLIINDGSTDDTVKVARDLGVDHVVNFSSHQGLAKGFIAGLDACLREGADIIVNTDADDQYCADDIPLLLEPILAGEAEMVIGARPIAQTTHFSPIKKMLQKLGSWVVRKVSGTDVADAPSGFRAISRNAALQLNVFNQYTYTLETIIQAGHKGIRVVSVPIRTNEDLRPSRLVRSISSYVRRSILTILRIFVIYRPTYVFTRLAACSALLGTLLIMRWVYFYVFAYDVTRARAPSLIVAAVLLLAGVQFFTFGLVADLLGTNRKILEELQLRLRRRDHRRDDA